MTKATSYTAQRVLHACSLCSSYPLFSLPRRRGMLPGYASTGESSWSLSRRHLLQCLSNRTRAHRRELDPAQTCLAAALDPIPLVYHSFPFRSLPHRCQSSFRPCKNQEELKKNSRPVYRSGSEVRGAVLLIMGVFKVGAAVPSGELCGHGISHSCALPCVHTSCALSAVRVSGVGGRLSTRLYFQSLQRVLTCANRNWLDGWSLEGP